MSQELEAKIAALEARLNQLDADWHESFRRQIEDWNANFDDYSAIVVRARDGFYKDFDERTAHIEGRLSEHEQTVREGLDAYVQKLLATSSSEVVASALSVALKNTVLKTRPATREEVRKGDGVVVVRNAARGE
jgi:hypothetical protein